MNRFIPKPATPIAIFALVLAAGGSATAATLVTGAKIKNGSVTGADIKRGSIPASDLRSTARRSLRGAAGPRGPGGPAGAVGAPGAPGKPGTSHVFTAKTAPSGLTVTTHEGDKEVLRVPVPSGMFVVDAVVQISTNDGGGCSLVDSTGRQADGAEHGSGSELHVFQGTFTFRDNGEQHHVAVRCQSDSELNVERARLQAVAVDKIN